MTVEIEDHKNIRILAMNDGKLNCQSKPLRIALLEGLEAAAADSSCRAVVLLGRGRVFSAGADINEFDAPPETVEPHLNFVLIDAIESMPVPVIAAIHGTAVGGGLELALGCHYRVATPNAMLGLPEVTLGLMPGAGGTQRLPRAIGLESALNLMLSGRTIPADEMPAGLVDRIVDGDLEEAALAFAREIADVRPMPLLRQTKINYPDYEGFLEFARGAAANDPRKMPGVIPVIDAVESAVRDPIEKAMLTEWQVFERLRTSAESAPFRYAFLAERKTVKIADIKSRPEPQSLKTAAVIGAGSMGAGIAVSLAEAGLAVKLLDTSAEALERGVKKCVSIWTKARDRGRIDDGKLKARIAALTTASTYEEIADCDLVVEAVLEEMPVKRAVFEALDKVMKPHSLLVSNTSSLDIDEIASFTSRPGFVLGMHFFNPANIMKLVEVVRGEKTSDQSLITAMVLCRKLRKVPVVSGVCDGFIGNRMIEQYGREAGFLIEEGALPEQVDRALEKFGMAMGPFRMADLVGHDIPWAVRRRQKAEVPGIVFPDILDIVCEKGWFGQKTGLGWYRYKPNDRKPLKNPDLLPLIEENSGRLGLTRRKITDEEIVERCILALVNEGAAILADGIAQRASDIDIAYLYGYGFPRFRGGPMFYADSIGLFRTIRKMRKFAENTHGDPAFWEPHPLLIELAQSNRSLSDYGARS